MEVVSQCQVQKYLHLTHLTVPSIYSLSPRIEFISYLDTLPSGKLLSESELLNLTNMQSQNHLTVLRRLGESVHMKDLYKPNNSSSSILSLELSYVVAHKQVSQME